ncbi:liprin-alpha-1-like [Bos indicus x Bos taurus]|uniref:liprin-alpha-1-like n=1 Tax=Bos indicus x Bos taurus TaxID=30522 RepID=UPI000F7D1684|nr:liprin-alpha-1-like [Bos indicus x Bos taurus]
MVKKMELQEIIERQLREQSQMEERLAALSAHVKHLEEDLDTARKDLLKSKNMNRKLEQDIRETEDKNRQLQERLELVEKLQQRLRRAETLPEVEAEQAQRVASLSKVLLWKSQQGMLQTRGPTPHSPSPGARGQSEEGGSGVGLVGLGHGEHVSSHELVTSILSEPCVTHEAAQAV